MPVVSVYAVSGQRLLVLFCAEERQRIKRKVARWSAKYVALPPAERLVIMVALGEVNSDR